MREGMNQVELMERTLNMKVGQRLTISKQDMIRCAEGSLRSAFDYPVRKEDIDAFIFMASRSWGIKFTQNFLEDTWTVHKVEET